MLSLIMAAVLAAAPVHAPAPPVSPITQNEHSLADVAQDQENYCLQVVTEKMPIEQAIHDLNLDTDAKKEDFGLHCDIFLDGVSAGIKSQEESKNNKNEDTD